MHFHLHKFIVIELGLQYMHNMDLYCEYCSEIEKPSYLAIK